MIISFEALIQKTYCLMQQTQLVGSELQEEPICKQGGSSRSPG